MAVYVDNVQIKWQGAIWCHLVADTLEELHQFAVLLGLKREWFQDSASYPHYDIILEQRDRALLMGATLGTRRQIITAAKNLKHEWEVTHQKPWPPVKKKRRITYQK